VAGDQGESCAIQTVACAGKSLGVLASRLKRRGSVQQPPLSRLFVSVCEAIRASRIVGHYLSWKLLVCAPEPWVLIVFILSPSPPYASASPFPLCSSAILFRFRFTTCLVSLNSIIPSPQAVTPSTCPILLSLYQHWTHPFSSIAVWFLASNSNAATLADLRLFIMGLPSCRN